MNVEILNNQTDLKIFPAAIPSIIKAVLDLEKAYCDEVSLSFVDKEEISKLHQDFFDDPSPTDCISFPMDDPREKSGYLVLGEIFVCPAVAIEYALDHQVDAYDELTLYIVHGLLHLLGYDDREEDDKAEMRLAEARHLENLKAQEIQLERPPT